MAHALSLSSPPESTQSQARPLSLEEKDISRFRSLVSAPLKGLLKSLPSIAKLQDPISLFLPKSSAESFLEQQRESLLPTQPKFAEHALQRFGEAAPYAAMGGLGGIASAGAGALSGQIAEELGAPEWLQTVAEIAPQAVPSLARKIVPSNKQQESLLALARKHGLSEEQIAPLIPETGKQKFFGKIASKGESTVQKLKETRKGASQIFENLKNSPEAQKFLSLPEMQKMATEVNRIGQNLPHAVRSQLHNDAMDLVKSFYQKGGVDGAELMNFYRDISSRYNLGKSSLELFKNPIKQAISSLDPQLAKDFDTVNNIWMRQAKISKTLSPKHYDELISMGEAYATAAAAASGDISKLSKILGHLSARRFANSMLTSPRLQNIVTKSQKAIQKNQLPILKKLGDLILDEYQSQSENNP